MTRCSVMFSGTWMMPPSRSTTITSSRSAMWSWCAECTPIMKGVGEDSTWKIFYDIVENIFYISSMQTSSREWGRTGTRVWE